MQFSLLLDLTQPYEQNNDLFKMLSSYNKSLLPDYQDYTAFSLYIKNGDKILGGAMGKIWLGFIHINRLFVDEQIRNLGYGGKLLEKIELCGRENGASFISLENLSFQNSLNFYLKKGFKIIFEENVHNNKAILYHLRKSIEVS